VHARGDNRKAKMNFLLRSIIIGTIVSISTSVFAQSIRSCDDFINHWLNGYEYAKTYRAYECETTTLNNGRFVIFGKPGTKSTDQWFYQPKSQTILRINPDTSYGRKAQTVYRARDFSIVSESETQGSFATPRGEAAQNATRDIKGNYCAVAQGGPPMGCGLTLSDCNRVVSGLAGMYCVQQ